MKQNIYKALAVTLVTVYLASVVWPGVVYATPAPQTGTLLTSTASQEPKRGHNPETGKVSFIGGGHPIDLPGVDNVKDMTLLR
jgi:hypothetical protein